MVIGEDKSKVQNIVKPNVSHFQKLYSNILQDCPQVVYKHHLGRLEASVLLLNSFKASKWKCFITLTDGRNYATHQGEQLSALYLTFVVFLLFS